MQGCVMLCVMSLDGVSACQVCCRDMGDPHGVASVGSACPFPKSGASVCANDHKHMPKVNYVSPKTDNGAYHEQSVSMSACVLGGMCFDVHCNHRVMVVGHIGMYVRVATNPVMLVTPHVVPHVCVASMCDVE